MALPGGCASVAISVRISVQKFDVILCVACHPFAGRRRDILRCWAYVKSAEEDDVISGTEGVTDGDAERVFLCCRFGKLFLFENVTSHTVLSVIL